MSAPEFPAARVETRTAAGWTRLLPLLALILAVVLVREAWNERGARLTVHADQGHGLRAGDALRYRGIEVGRVEAVELGTGAEEVLLRVRLMRSASSLARAGSRFWIARPVVGVEGVSGLETALGSRYLAVLPGPPGGASQEEFTALEEPPLHELEDPSALEVVLLADDRAGLGRGAPVLYRGIQIGSIVSVALASDASVVEARARIHPQHAELVRTDSRFYRTKGAALRFGLGGLELSVDSLQGLWLGGVGLATPTHPGTRAATGQRFEMAAEPEEEWLAWRPALAVGSRLVPGELRPPERRWARLEWKGEGWFGRTRSRGGWIVPLPEGWLGPADVLAAPEDAAAASVVLELAGERLPLEGAPAWSADGLARRVLPGSPAAPATPSRRALAEPEDLLLCADPALAPVAVSAAHLERDGAGWRVAERLSLDERWNGAAAMARGDGAWLGLLLVEEGGARVVPLPAP